MEKGTDSQKIQTNTTWACTDAARKAKAQLELKLVWIVTNNKEPSVNKSITSRSVRRKGWDTQGLFYFGLHRWSQPPNLYTKKQLQRNGKPPIAGEGWVRDKPYELDTYRLMGLDGMYQRDETQKLIKSKVKWKKKLKDNGCQNINLIMCASGYLHCAHLVRLVPGMKFASLSITFLFLLTAYKIKTMKER